MRLARKPTADAAADETAAQADTTDASDAKHVWVAVYRCKQRILFTLTVDHSVFYSVMILHFTFTFYNYSLCSNTVLTPHPAQVLERSNTSFRPSVRTQ